MMSIDPKVPDDFLRTVDSMSGFAQALLKIKKCGRDGVHLTHKEAQSVVWGLQLLNQRQRDDE